MSIFDFLFKKIIPQEKRKRIVLLSEEFSKTLDDLAELWDETNGVLIHKPQEVDGVLYCGVLHVYMTGKGTPGHVIAEPERIDIINELLNSHPRYDFVKFHTHSRGTIKTFGNFYAKNFSSGDIDSYKEQLAHNPDFIGMVVTPEIKLLWGVDDPILRIARQYPHSVESQISQELDAIAQRKGYTLEPFRSVRRKKNSI